MKKPTKQCICDEISAKMGYESRTFKCPKHGQITIDKRWTTYWPNYYWTPYQTLPNKPIDTTPTITWNT